MCFRSGASRSRAQGLHAVPWKPKTVRLDPAGGVSVQDLSKTARFCIMRFSVLKLLCTEVLRAKQ